MTSKHVDEPVTALFYRTAKEGREAEYEAWNKHLIGICERQPGCMNTSVVAEGGRRYITIQRFESQRALQSWLNSPLRLERLGELKELTEEAPEPAAITGLEPWFRLPGVGGKEHHIPRWKMALVTFVVIYVCITLLIVFVSPHVEHLPLLLRTALFPLLMVPLLTYVVMPRLTRLLRDWLYE